MNQRFEIKSLFSLIVGVIVLLSSNQVLAAKKKCLISFKAEERLTRDSEVEFELVDGKKIIGKVKRSSKSGKSTARIKRKDCVEDLEDATFIGVLDKEEEQGSFDGSSEGIRKKRKYGAKIGGGNVIGGLSGIMAEVDYFVSPSFVTGIGLYSGSLSLPDLSTSATIMTTGKLSGTMIFTKAKYFVGNSFYLTGVFGQRTIEAHAEIFTVGKTDGIIVNTNSSSITVGLNIGNQWSFDSGFTIGVDWIGYHNPIFASSSSSTETKGVVTTNHEEFAKDSEELAETLGAVGSGTLFVLGLGFEL